MNPLKNYSPVGSNQYFNQEGKDFFELYSIDYIVQESYCTYSVIHKYYKKEASMKAAFEKFVKDPNGFSRKHKLREGFKVVRVDLKHEWHHYSDISEIFTKKGLCYWGSCISHGIDKRASYFCTEQKNWNCFYPALPWQKPEGDQRPIEER